MAQRRMFSPKVTSTDKFLDLPVSARELYFQLGMNADDDGFVTPKKIMRMIGAKQKDLDDLFSNDFIIQFKSGVIVIRAWRINNLIRKDWYQQTIHLDEKKLLDVDNKGEYFLVNENVPNSLTEYSLVKDSIDNISLSPPGGGDHQQQVVFQSEKERVPYEKIVELYHYWMGKTSTSVKKLSETRKKQIRSRWNNELKDLEAWNSYFERASQSDFLNGRTQHLFFADFDWLIKEANCLKLLEDKYSNYRR